MLVVPGENVLIHFYGMHHGKPTADGSQLDTLGRQQVTATRKAHLKGIRFVGALASDMPRAQAALSLALYQLPKPDFRDEANEDLGYEWFTTDRRLPKFPYPETVRKPQNAFELIEHWTPATAIGFKLFAAMETLATNWFSIEQLENDGVANYLLASHRNVLEAAAIVPNNKRFDLRGIPLLGYGDVLRYTLEWTDRNPGTPDIVAIDHLPCPLNT